MFQIHVSFPLEVRLCLGALGISPVKTQAVCKGLSAHRLRLPVSHLQEVSQNQTHMISFVVLLFGFSKLFVQQSVS